MREGFEGFDGGVLGARVVAQAEEPAPELGEARKLAGGAILDAGVFDQADEKHLRLAQLLGRDRGAGVHDMGGQMRGHRPVEVVSLHPGDVVHRVGQVHHMGVDIGAEALVIGRRGAQEEVAAPERAQVKVELALGVDEQRAAALLLEHLAAVGAVEGEVFGQVGQIAPVGLGAEIGPAFEAREGELREQFVDDPEHRSEATGGLGRELVDELEIAAQ